MNHIRDNVIFLLALIVLSSAVTCAATATAVPEAANGTNDKAFETTSGKIPERFAVGPTYPNPFNTFAALEYDVPADAHVRVWIFNILGYRVRDLIDRMQPPGSYRMYWDGTNDGGLTVPSGIYITVILADDNYAVRKMVLIK